MQLEIFAGKGNRLILLQQLPNNLYSLFEAVEAFGRRQQVKSIELMLAFLPARPKAERQASPGKVVNCGRHARGQRWMSEGDRRNQRAKTDAVGVARQPGER